MINRGLTLIETLLVFSLMAILATGAFISVGGVRNSQALVASGKNLGIVLERARIYSRDGRDDKAWGVAAINDSGYNLLSGAPGSFTVVQSFELSPPTRFESPGWNIWFKPVVGDADQAEEIVLVNAKGRLFRVLVSTAGLIELRY